jgi:zinc protease
MFKRMSLFLLIIWVIPLVAQKYNIYNSKLENGLEIIVIENSSVPLVTIEIDVRNGAYTEPPEFDGLSHLYEHMFFKANESIPSQEKYMERLRELGMIFNGSTSSERVNYFFTVHKDSLLPAMDFMKAAILTPLFLEEELVRERPVVTGEFDRNEANPYFHLNRAVDQKLWYKYFSRKNVIGDRNVILSADHDKMLTIKNRFYIPNNSALMIAGDVEHNNIFKLAKKYFTEWERREDPFEKFPIPEHPPLKSNQTVIVEKPVNAVTLQIAMQGPSVSKDMRSTFAADVFSFILGQNNSAFQKNLVQSGLFNNVNLTYYTQDHTGPITVFAQTTADKYEQAQKALFAEIDKFTMDDYFTDEQIEYAKTQLEMSEMFGQERPSTFVHTLGFWWCVGGGLDYYLNYIENLKSITRDDITKYINTYIKNKPYVKGILLSPSDRAKLGITAESRKDEAL